MLERLAPSEDLADLRSQLCCLASMFELQKGYPAPGDDEQVRAPRHSAD